MTATASATTREKSPGRNRRTLIRASAGTGKTFQLSNRFLDLLFEGVAADQLLATTFTRKAAGEILDRVLLRLADAGLEPAVAKTLPQPASAKAQGKETAARQGLRQLAAALNRPNLTRADCLKQLVQLTRQLHRLRISTLDSFFAQMARTFSLELGLPPGWQIADPLEDERIRNEAIDAVLRSEDSVDLVTLVHLLTKGEAQRGVAQLVRDTVDGLYDLFCEAEPAAWSRVPRCKPLEAEALAGVIESLRQVAMPGKRMVTARDTDCDRAEAGEWAALADRGLGAKVLAGELTYYRQPIPEPAVDCYRPLMEHARAELVAVVLNQTEATHGLLKRFHVEYQRLKQQRRALRFEDITRRLAALVPPDDAESGDLSNSTAAGSATQSYSYRLDAPLEHLLLDEFQDTAPVQWRVLRPFARRTAGGEEPGRSFFCVGDVKQAIYGWRGGVAEIFQSLVDELPGLDDQALNKSYRSAPPITEAVNQVFRGIGCHTNLGRSEAAVQQWSACFPEHETDRGDLPGYVALVTADEAPAERSQRRDPVYDRATEQICQLVHDAPGASIGVLVRSNEAVGQMIHRLRERGVWASEEGGNPLTDSAAVQLILSLLKLADHPGDTVAVYHVLHSPLAAVVGLTGGSGKLTGGKLDDRRGSPWSASRQVRRQLLDDGYGPAIGAWAGVLDSACDGREWTRLQQLVELAYGFQSRATLRTADFLALVRHQRVSDPTAAPVRVMTVHQAKGLEFDCVVLPQLDEPLTGQPDWFVASRPGPAEPADLVLRYTNEAIQQMFSEQVQDVFHEAHRQKIVESLCVMYVALTRAVHGLYMVVAPSSAREAKLPRTMAGLLRAALCDGQRLSPRQTVFELGQREWHRSWTPKRDAKPSAAASFDETAVGAEVTWPARPGQRRRGLELAHPSGLEGGGRVSLDSLFQPGNGAALQYGTLIHGWFELIQWLDETPSPDPLDDATLHQAAHRALADEPAILVDIEQAVGDFRRMLARDTVRQALQRDRYSPNPDHQLEVLNERRFAVMHQGSVLTGTIDRLVLTRHQNRVIAAEILDFKTDNLAAAGQLEKKVSHYRPQLDAYRHAVGRMTTLDARDVTAGLLFVQTGELVMVNANGDPHPV